MRLKALIIFGMFILLVGAFFGLAQLTRAQVATTATPPLASSESQAQALIAHLNQQTGGAVRISYHAETGVVRFLGAAPDNPMAQPALLAPGASLEAAARGFLGTYGQLFGLKDPARELTVLKTRTLGDGRSFVRFQQVYRDIPILGGELIVQENARRDVISVNGEILPDLALDTTPAIDAETARQIALAKVARDYALSTDDLTASDPELWIYNPAIMGGLGPRFSSLVWRTEVTPLELAPINEFVLVDARLGTVALHFNQIDTALYRAIYDNQNNPAYGLPGNGPVRVEGGAATGIADADATYDYSGDTYNFYYHIHGRDSIDDAGMTLSSTVRYSDTLGICPNAFWNGSQMVYCEDLVVDDVVAHELTHGVTSSESKLFYWYQSGAINEAFSDVWGEFVDLVNGAGNDDPSVRWQLGEDIPPSVFGGAIRDMSNPSAHNQPDRMGDTSNYWCGEGDNGGVHVNSGVGNKAAYLMVDGGSFGGTLVIGIGITKTAKIWYEVQTNLFTSASDYQDLYDGLGQACTNLIGSSGITAADCQQVKSAIDATEMNQQPTSCAANEAPICDAGLAPVHLFLDDLENPSSGKWISGTIVGYNTWYYPQTPNPLGFDATYATSGEYNIWGYNVYTTTDSYIAMTTGVALPSGVMAYMHFNHAYAFEDWFTATYDGGVLEYSTDGGTSWNDASSLITHNGYTGVITDAAGNPLGGRSAFVGESNGYISSRLDLSSLAGGSVRFRFRMGTDGAYDAHGWFIDDVRIYTCNFFIYLPLAVKDQQ